MAGLLDFFDNDNARFSLGLLAAAAPRSDRISLGQRMEDAMGTFDAYKKAKMQGELNDLTIRKTKAELAAQEARLADAARARAIELANPFGSPGATQSVPLGQGAGLDAATMASLPPMFQTPVIAPPQQQKPVQAPAQPVSNTQALYNHYSRMAALYSQNGLPDQATAAATLAEKFKPEYFGEPRVVKIGGKLANVLIGKDGSIRTMDGMGVKPDMVEMDLGGTKQFVDKNELAPGASFTKTMTPGEIASNKVAWANYAVSKANSDREAAGTPVWNNELGMYVNPRTMATDMPIDSATGKKMVSQGKPLTEDQGKATGWYMQAVNATNNMARAIDPEQGGTPKAMQKGWQDRLAVIPGAESLVNQTRSVNRQAFMQATNAFTEALLRAASGANVPAHEMQQKISELTPVFGEHPSVTQQKLASIPVYLESLRLRSGQGAERADKVLRPLLTPPTAGVLDTQKADKILANRNKG